MTYGQLSDYFKKYFGQFGGSMQQSGYGLIRGTEDVEIRELKAYANSPIIPVARVSFSDSNAIVRDMETGRVLVFDGKEL